jgi:hypothetical protein
MKNETVGALMMVKDEIDIIEHNINYLSTQELDLICVYDNNSTDGTGEKLSWLSDIHDELLVLNDSVVGYYQADKMNKWANEIFQDDIDVVIPIDADEIWYSKNPNCTLGGAIRATDADIFVARSMDYIPTLLDNFGEPNFIKRMKYRKKDSNSFNAVAFNYSPEFWLEMGNHNVLNHPGDRVSDVIGIRHYQYRSFDQFRKKVSNGKKAYDATNLPEYMGSHWRKLGAMTNDELREYWFDYCVDSVVNDPFVAKNYA